MAKFGADVTDRAAVIIVMSKYGPAHATKQYDGRYVVCPRRAALCKLCAEEGVPQYPPDPFDVACDALRANYGKRWAESHRHPGELADDEVWQGRGLHIVALSDEDPADRTVLVSFGENDEASAAISALVHVHNEMIGRPD
jgi:hypothetical protein